MKARWSGLCPKCESTWQTGDQIKPLYRRAGFDQGKPIWVRVPKAYVHAPRCPKVTPNRPGQKQWDPLTGELIVEQSTSPTQEALW